MKIELVMNPVEWHYEAVQAKKRDERIKAVDTVRNLESLINITRNQTSFEAS